MPSEKARLKRDVNLVPEKGTLLGGGIEEIVDWKRDRRQIARITSKKKMTSYVG